MTSNLTRQDKFHAMEVERNEREVLRAAKEWLRQWNVLGPDEDSVHKELFDAVRRLGLVSVFRGMDWGTEPGYSVVIPENKP